MSAKHREKVAILGAGTWGLGLTKVLWENQNDLRLWDLYSPVIESLRQTRGHRRLPGFKLAEGVPATDNLAEALEGARVAVVVVPSFAVRSLCETVKAAGLEGGVEAWVVCCKGIEQSTMMLMHEVMTDVLGEAASSRIAALSGPSHAEEVVQGLPASVVACAKDPALAKRVQELFFQPRFRVYTSDDVTGVELGGSIKNVVAIAAGVADGMGFGDSTRAALITRSLAEIVRLGVAMGARLETFMGLSGIGDLIATAVSPHSRNHQFGELLAKGRSCEEALREVGMVVEGYVTAKSAYALGQKHGVDMPISEAVHQMLYRDVPARTALEALLSREPKAERR